ncbi:MAG: hypothetical protein K2L54_05620 [Clostridiales bacterium]|nr:hypothetical protein [Clostridiales bacterium]
MKKVRITADAVLAIIRGVFEDEDIDIVVDENEAPEVWQGKTISEILNVEYYTYKHRPSSTLEAVQKILKEKGEANELAALNSAYGLLAIDSIERLFSKDVDMVVLQARLSYYIQTDKIKLLEYLVEDANIATSGIRIPVQFGSETRKAVIFFDRPQVDDIQTAAPFGETAIVDIDVAIMLYPDVVSYSDYTVNIEFTENGEAKNADVPLSSFSIAETMTQDAVPGIQARESVGEINLSRATSFVLVFDGYNNPFINYITDKQLASGKTDNNERFTMNITRAGKTYTHTVVVKDHQTTVNADTGNETHTLTFTKRGIKNGTT